MSVVSWRYDPEHDHPTSLVGFRVWARDGQVGTVDPATWDTDADAVIVAMDAGGLLRRVLIPSRFIDVVDIDRQSVHVGLTAAQVNSATRFVGEGRPRPAGPA